MGLPIRARLDHDDVAAHLVVGIHRLGQRGGLGVHQHVRQHHGERLVAHHLPGAPYGVAEAQGLHLAHEAHLPGLGQFPLEVRQDLGLALGAELGLEFGVVVEIVLDGRLAAAHDEDEVFDARGPALGHDVGKDRAIDDVEQVLRGGLPDRQDPRAKSRDRKDGDTNPLHETPLSTQAP